MKQHGISGRRACRFTGLARSTRRRKQQDLADDGGTERLKELARDRQRFDYRCLTALLRRKGRHVNHKRIYRLYRDLGLAMRRRKRKHNAYRLAITEKASLRKGNQRWAMDVVCDTLAFGRTCRILTIVDEHTREFLATEADPSLPGLRVIRVLDQLALTRGLTEEIHGDHGPEFVSRALRAWCEEHRV